VLFRNQGSIVEEILLKMKPAESHPSIMNLRLGYSRETPLSSVERLRHGPKGHQPRQLIARLKMQGSAGRGNATRKEQTATMSTTNF